MTTGATLYLVSACGSAEEFVAAFRRYADRTGLFIPSAAPLPAGRRGRLALTLKDGGVMITGDAEILQSSARPTVLYGRPGMTVKFVAPDDPSKTMIAELEKARLAMKPAAPTVAPRPADIPAEPRPIVPPVGGRIDAANALAECVVIGDLAILHDTSAAPKAVADPGSSKKFVVPSIPLGGARPKPMTTPPAMQGRPRTPSTPPDVSRPKTGTTPPDPASRPLPVPAHVPSSKLTSIGFPAIDKLPALSTPAPAAPIVAPAKPPAKPLIDPNSPLLKTTPGTLAPANLTKQMSAEVAPLVDEEATTVGEAPPAAAPAAPPKKATDPMPAAVPVAVATPPPSTPKQTPPSSSSKHKATSLGFPVVRAPVENKPLVLVRPAPAEPAAPIVPKATDAGRTASPAPRGKNPTRPPLVPRQPTPVAPVPIVRSPAAKAPPVEDETTDIAGAPQPTPSAASETAVAAPAYTDAARAADAAVSAPAARSGGMRASEILAAIPTADWTMSPDASAPTVVPSKGWTPAAGQGLASPPDEPTPAPTTPPKGPPTGDWTISLDPAAPEAGWSPPAKVEKPRPQTAGNTIAPVASETPIQAVEWEEKPTGIGEAKIEIDPTLMEPLKPMPELDDDSVDPLASPPAAASPFAVGDSTGPSPFAAPPPLGANRAGTEPLAGVAALGAALRMPSGAVPQAPPPLVGSQPTSQQIDTPGRFPTGGMPAASPGQQLFDPNSQGGMFGFAQPVVGGAVPGRDARRRKLLIIAGAAAAVAAGFVLVLLLSGNKQQARATVDTGSDSTVAGSGSDSGSAAITSVGSGSADDDSGSGSGTDSGSAVAAIVPPLADAGVAEQPDAAVESGACQVTITSVPLGAEVFVGKTTHGKTPAQFELPCGTETKVTLKKPRYINTARAFTPISGKANKVVVRLAKTTFTLKVTSTPAGATIKSGRRSVGVTPTTIRLPAYEASVIVLSKPGYANNTKKVTPKSNNTSHHVTLKKASRR